ncbi:MAG: KpsF/GutQ family sugar-phosphate isomerase [Candidatus Pelagibacter sp. TMED286]|nr:MAG: KpsF/GutQ family sugar-phosphate isomerase [Candidatus Pelagibacter sp. TMED286]|tara:strand:+ start:342 stop:1319 length:978 start_codon:yes stop_codon:yes gene_type:complete
MKKKNYISLAIKAANTQIKELKKIKKVFNKSFIEAIDLISNTKGKIIFSGVGKNSFICKKAAATFSSVGIPSFFVDPTGVSHGDAGQIEKKDTLIIISNSGNTAELKNLLKFANRFRIKIIGVASNVNSMLLKASDVKIVYPHLRESDPNNIVPTTSTSFVMMLCDCLATTIMEKRKFTKENFFLYHKGGNLGASLRLAKDIMVTGKKMPVIDYKSNFKQALKLMNEKKLGIVVITKNKFINGLITDGDLRRVLNDSSKKRVLSKITRNYPYVINESMSASKALGFMSEKKITSLLVVSDKDKAKKNKTLKGIIHIHFLLKDEIR